MVIFFRKLIPTINYPNASTYINNKWLKLVPLSVMYIWLNKSWSALYVWPFITLVVRWSIKFWCKQMEWSFCGLPVQNSHDVIIDMALISSNLGKVGPGHCQQPLTLNVGIKQLNQGGYEHCPLLLQTELRLHPIQILRKPGLLMPWSWEVIHVAWELVQHGSPIYRDIHKLSRTKKALKSRNKMKVGEKERRLKHLLVLYNSKKLHKACLLMSFTPWGWTDLHILTCSNSRNSSGSQSLAYSGVLVRSEHEVSPSMYHY